MSSNDEGETRQAEPLFLHLASGTPCEGIQRVHIVQLVWLVMTKLNRARKEGDESKAFCPVRSR